MQKNKDIKILIITFLVSFFINNKIALAYELNCESMKETIGIVNEVLGIIKIAIPILLIALGTMDFIKAMVAQDDQKMKKAQTTFVQRLIIGVVIFFVPMIMRFLLNIIGMGNSCLYDYLNF